MRLIRHILVLRSELFYEVCLYLGPTSSCASARILCNEPGHTFCVSFVLLRHFWTDSFCDTIIYNAQPWKLTKERHFSTYNRGLLWGEVFEKLTFFSVVSLHMIPYITFCSAVTDQDSNVLPGGGAPVRIVITFLWYFKSPSLPIWVLPGVNCTVTF